MSADPSSLHLAILRRNARLRAWRSAGVPVEGGWVYRAPGGAYPEDPAAAYLALHCLACGARTRSETCSTKHWEIQPDFCEYVERGKVQRLGEGGCPHLAPLLSPEDPPEVVATTELEMLAG